MAFSIRLTEQEKKLAESYAKLHSLSLGEAFKKRCSIKLTRNLMLPYTMKLIKNTRRAERKAVLLMSCGRNSIYEV